jgi:hypothetical protein
MPDIKIQHVVSCSSADKVKTNLHAKGKSSDLWSCDSSVVLQTVFSESDFLSLNMCNHRFNSDL